MKDPEERDPAFSPLVLLIIALPPAILAILAYGGDSLKPVRDALALRPQMVFDALVLLAILAGILFPEEVSRRTRTHRLAIAVGLSVFLLATSVPLFIALPIGLVLILQAVFATKAGDGNPDSILGKPVVYILLVIGGCSLYYRNIVGPYWSGQFTSVSRQLAEAGPQRPQKPTDGPWRENWPGGEVKIEGQYSAGKPVGTWKMYHRDGWVMSETPYAEGKIHGTLRQYYPSGELRQSSEWTAGIMNGPLLAYDERGDLVAETEYRNNKPVSFMSHRERGR